jgi:hypothetical protein
VTLADCGYPVKSRGYPVKSLWFTCPQQLLNYLALSVPDEGHSRNTSWEHKTQDENK